MFFCVANVRVRHISIALAVISVFLLGCARKLQIEVPVGYHGRVHITCTGLTTDRASLLRAAGGEVTAATCPERQADVVVTRSGDASPVDATVMWTTTGDGLVREILFDVK